MGTYCSVGIELDFQGERFLDLLCITEFSKHYWTAYFRMVHMVNFVGFFFFTKIKKLK